MASVTYTQDVVGWVLTRTADNATTTFSYDPERRWVAASNAVSTDTAFVDARGRPEKDKTILAGVPNGTITRGHTWDPQGWRKALTYAGGGTSGTIGYTYDGASQLTEFRAFNHLTKLAYNATGLIDTVQIRAGTTGAPINKFEYSYSHMPSRVRWNVSALETSLGAHYQWNTRDQLTVREEAWSPTGGGNYKKLEKPNYRKLSTQPLLSASACWPT